MQFLKFILFIQPSLSLQIKRKKKKTVMISERGKSKVSEAQIKQMLLQSSRHRGARWVESTKLGTPVPCHCTAHVLVSVQLVTRKQSSNNGNESICNQAATKDSAVLKVSSGCPPPPPQQSAAPDWIRPQSKPIADCSAFFSWQLPRSAPVMICSSQMVRRSVCLFFCWCVCLFYCACVS